MTKENEKAYLKSIGEDGRMHALDKPYSDLRCGAYFTDIGSIMSILPPPPGTLLDLGVGTGWTSLFLARRGYEVTGQDLAEDMIALAEENRCRYSASRVTFIASDYEDLTFDEKFDYALFNDSLHHSTNPQQAIDMVYRALKPGGMVITLEPGFRHASSREAQFAMKKWGVTENNMPPSLVIKMGKNAGFSKMKIYVRRYDHPLETLPYLNPRGCVNLLKTLLRFLPVSCSMVSNITVMWK